MSDPSHKEDHYSDPPELPERVFLRDYFKHERTGECFVCVGIVKRLLADRRLTVIELCVESECWP